MRWSRRIAGVWTVLAVAALLPAGPRTGSLLPTIRLALPLPSELPVTASFGEFRSGHFHAGLDFSTRRELGWPVRAAADGEVTRLKVEVGGYGRAVYIRHAGGFETVYGHLHAFEERLEEFVGRERVRLGRRYPGDLYPRAPVPVRQGQVIGFSGENGSGPAHLHLELRHRGTPVDPVRYGGIVPQGFASPVLERLHILPRGPCRVNGGWAPVSLPFEVSTGGPRVLSTPTVEGPCNLAVEARIPGGGTMGLSALALDCGEGRFLRMDLSRFTFEQSRQVGLLYDVARSSSNGRFVYRLQPGSELDLPGVAAAGVEQLPPGNVQCILRARSATGEEVRGSFSLDVREPPPYESSLPALVESFDLSERLLLVNGTLPLDPLRLPEAARHLPGMPFLRIPGEGGELPAVGGVELQLPKGAFYREVPISWARAPEVLPAARGLRPVAAAVRLAPDGLFLRHGARLVARPPDPSRSAFYRLDPRARRWNPMEGSLEAGALVAETRVGGVFAVLQDDSRPRITGVRLRTESRLGARRLVFPVQEVGQGIEWDAFQVRIDGRTVDAEYDPDRRWGHVWLPDELQGRHRVEARCRDRAGNVSSLFQATVTL